MSGRSTGFGHPDLGHVKAPATDAPPPHYHSFTMSLILQGQAEPSGGQQLLHIGQTSE